MSNLFFPIFRPICVYTTCACTVVNHYSFSQTYSLFSIAIIFENNWEKTVKTSDVQ